MLYIVGLGLYSSGDLSLRGLEVVKQADAVYAEFYTGFHAGGVGELSKVAGREVVELSRSDIEEGAEKILAGALNSDVVLLVPGDPLVATTHVGLVLRAKEMGVGVEIIHASSIVSAVAETGLSAYKFGKTTTLPYPQEGYKPTSPYEVVGENREQGLHTLCLLDVKCEEGCYMTVGEGIKVLLAIEGEKGRGVFTPETLCVGVARLGADDSVIKAGKAGKLMEHDFGGPAHALIVPGKLHYMEEGALALFRVQ